MSEKIKFNFLKIFLGISLAWIIIYCFIILAGTSNLKDIIFDPMSKDVTQHQINIIKITSLIFIIVNTLSLVALIIWFIINYINRNNP